MIEITELSIPNIEIIGTPITALPFQEQINIILRLAKSKLGGYVCVANTHMLVEAYKKPKFQQILASAEMVTPDGTPLVWMMRLLGYPCQDRVAGMDILKELCHQAILNDLRVFFLGSQPIILKRMKQRLQLEFPNLNIAGMESLPFTSGIPEVDSELIRYINSSSDIVFVSLGCPKQEYWMAKHAHEFKAVLIGLGGVFPICAGIHRHAPQLIRTLGLEWLYRLVQEPRRLWRRYFTTIPVFLFLAMKQILKELMKSYKIMSNISH